MQIFVVSKALLMFFTLVTDLATIKSTEQERMREREREIHRERKKDFMQKLSESSASDADGLRIILQET